MKTIILLVALIALALGLSWTDPVSRIGVIAGLGFGILLGPARIAGVDFRQWFRDPQTPSEIGDDTFIGLVRSAFRALWGSGLVAVTLLALSVYWWGPHAGAPSGPPWLMTISGYVPAWLKVLLGALLGVAIVQGMVELVWRRGLAHRLPPPQRTTEYLATQKLPFLPPKQNVAGRRRLIICCDGTWNWPEPERETNVVRLVRALTPQGVTANREPITQVVHYHQGVGTGNFVDRIVGGGAGVGLAASVKACYGFLVDNYQPGDEIFLFGFSRGAYVVRALGGVIRLLGMMRKEDMAWFAEAWNWYWQEPAKRDPATLDLIASQRHRNVEIECVGVWDTVGALGIPGSRFCRDAFAFHETSLGAHVRHAFQALAIDEQRGNFQGAIWVPSGESDASRQNEAAGGPQQVLKQVWFPGVHSNIGGGYKKHGLSDSSFLWMLSQLAQQNLLTFDQNCILSSLDHDPEIFPVGTLEDSRTVFWKLIGSPVPRPVCVISDTEYVHESAALRAGAIRTHRDAYKFQPRRDWLTAMTRDLPGRPKIVTTRDPFESTIGGSPRPRRIRPMKIKKDLDWCSWLLELVSARG